MKKFIMFAVVAGLMTFGMSAFADNHEKKHKDEHATEHADGAEHGQKHEKKAKKADHHEEAHH